MNIQSRKVFWNNHIQNWEKSGESQSSYCQKNNINLKTFYAKKSLYIKSISLPQPSKLFHTVKETKKNQTFKINLSNGIELNFDELPNPIWLGKILSEINIQDV